MLKLGPLMGTCYGSSKSSHRILELKWVFCVGTIVISFTSFGFKKWPQKTGYIFLFCFYNYIATVWAKMKFRWIFANSLSSIIFELRMSLPCQIKLIITSIRTIQIFFIIILHAKPSPISLHRSQVHRPHSPRNIGIGRSTNTRISRKPRYTLPLILYLEHH